MRRKITVAIAVFALVTVPAPASAAPNVSWVPCPQPQALKYHAECATIATSGATLALLRIPATESSQGPVFADSQEMDGYGGSQIDFFLRHGDNYLSRLPQTHRTHDIVLADPRGLGGSTPVRCPLPAHDPAVPELPATSADTARITAHGASVYFRCAAATGPLIAHTGLVEQADDLDAVRVALGAPRLDFLGQATGAELGVVYAARHPAHAGRLVLDTAVDPFVPTAQRMLDTAHAEEAAFGRFATWCDHTPEQCPLAGRDVGAVLDELGAHGAPGLTGDEVRIAVGQFLLGYPFAWPGLGHALATARDGDAGELAPYVALTYTDPEYTASHAQTCADHPSDPALLAGLAQKVRAAAPHTGGISLTWDALLSCTGWPDGAGLAERVPGHLAPASPVLITATADDPINPSSWATDLAARIAGSQVLVAPADGHGALDNAPCAANAIDAYLAAGTLPSKEECQIA
ncbi:alpha/beta hydrolase [Kutzneria kofuensis]|uniref:Pimeloyl-ACP methyl ester carboxylesterase n=1 Tax=Kutzneria kofuensis TaxID=103725 RepID=A0A7W9NMD7_9PSEU|nr:alpha/beta fold hydrolase [Kutzneria kofuensis]MBB5898025.1 pimeloyl-ACP methyl ester carboxylesterase [Kutzneria kofuensis]